MDLKRERDELLEYTDTVIDVMTRYRYEVMNSENMNDMKVIRRKMFLDEMGRNIVKYASTSHIDVETRFQDLEARFEEVMNALMSQPVQPGIQGPQGRIEQTGSS